MAKNLLELRDFIMILSKFWAVSGNNDNGTSVFVLSVREIKLKKKKRKKEK